MSPQALQSLNSGQATVAAHDAGQATSTSLPSSSHAAALPYPPASMTSDAKACILAYLQDPTFHQLVDEVAKVWDEVEAELSSTQAPKQ